MIKKTSDIIQQQTCSRCGTLFRCDIATGESQCWCFAHTQSLPVPENTAAGCFCPGCLQAALERHQSNAFNGEN
ncbi:MAG: cysteine-rich CWC family protein [Aggregatilineales bacterium]